MHHLDESEKAHVRFDRLELDVCRLVSDLPYSHGQTLIILLGEGPTLFQDEGEFIGDQRHSIAVNLDSGAESHDRLRCALDEGDEFFFSSRRRHTRWTGDWSSDVCSSD